MRMKRETTSLKLSTFGSPTESRNCSGPSSGQQYANGVGALHVLSTRRLEHLPGNKHCLLVSLGGNYPRKSERISNHSMYLLAWTVYLFFLMRFGGSWTWSGPHQPRSCEFGRGRFALGRCVFAIFCCCAWSLSGFVLVSQQKEESDGAIK
jgi:hypothetical protein